MESAMKVSQLLAILKGAGLEAHVLVDLIY
jgi:hypothetical protein